jgi:sucrose-6-phosphate hydrolase SacC (GH32 family)
MKKILIAAAILVSTSSFATTTTSSNDKGNLKSLLGKVSNVQWKSAANFEKASVVIEEQKVEVFYNQEGDLIGSTRYFAPKYWHSRLFHFFR